MKTLLTTIALSAAFATAASAMAMDIPTGVSQRQINEGSPQTATQGTLAGKASKNLPGARLKAEAVNKGSVYEFQNGGVADDPRFGPSSPR